MSKNNNKKISFKDFLKKIGDFERKIKKASSKERGEMLKDSDNDGLSDYEEINIYGTNPNNPDTDRDGMKDGEEVKKGRNPLGKGALKDMFIPHKGNSYQPEALSSKRLVFHGIGAIIAKMIIVSLLFSFPATAWMTPDVLKEESEDIIKFTNDIREEFDLDKLSEVEKLNQAALGKAQDMLIGQYFAHTDEKGRGLEYWIGNVDYNYSVAGENLALGFTTAKKTVEAWEKSLTHYANIKDRNFQEIGVAMVSGPYNNIETNLAVQYFARPVQKIAINTTPVQKPVKNPEIAQNSKIEIVKMPEKDVKVLSVKAELPKDTEKAIVSVKEKEIVLKKTNSGTWEAMDIVYKKEEKDIMSPAVPATISIENSSGNIQTSEIPWKNIEPKEITKSDQYGVYKENPTGLMAVVSKIGSTYFKILLFLSLMALCLSIFVEIRKQHPHLILRTLGFMVLLIIFIIF